ncbi:MAG: helix-turn-helix domain-containing protein [Clostridia bacterium]|nr:helix-turn-helix domain-containing protein [Clostridia bacterium]
MGTFAQRLSQARRQCGLTQAEVAEKLNVSFQAVSLWERAETQPEIGKLTEIARLLGVTTDWLLTDEPVDQAVLDIREKLSDRLFSEEKMYTYIKTYATVKGLHQTVGVLPYAKAMHKGQYRRGKDHVPYIYHPLLVACHALALGLDDDDLISAALLHDVCEDCGVMPDELPVNERTRRAVVLLTKDEGCCADEEAAQERYYRGIAADPVASMVKLLDRCCNISEMSSGFGRDRIVGYVSSTEKWIYPLMNETRTRYPGYANQVFLIKYHMTSVMEAIKHQL